MASRSPIAPCPRCDELTIRVDLHGAPVTLDRIPDPQGIVAASCDALGGWHARTETPGVAVAFPEKRYSLHDCGAQGAAETGTDVAYIDAAREARSGHRARQRAGRSTTRQPGVTGVRRRPR